MAEQEQQTSSKSSKSRKTGPKRGPGLAPIQGEAAPDDRPPERTPGDPAHLGGDRPYEGGDSPLVEGDPDARNR